MPDMVGIVQGLPVVLIPQARTGGLDVGKRPLTVGFYGNRGLFAALGAQMEVLILKDAARSPGFRVRAFTAARVLKGRSGEVPGLLSLPVVPFT